MLQLSVAFQLSIQERYSDDIIEKAESENCIIILNRMNNRNLVAIQIVNQSNAYSIDRQLCQITSSF